MKINLEKKLSGPFTALAVAMSRNNNVKIVPSGYECCTDGTTIKYPFNADYLQKADRAVLHGLLDHEIGHIREEQYHREMGRDTPLVIMKDIHRERGRTGGLMMNVFEDIRMEIHEAKQHIGVAQNLEAANVHSVELFRKRHGDGKLKHANFWHTLGCAIIMKARDRSVDWLPEGFVPFVDVIGDEIADSRTTSWAADSKALAIRVIEKIRDFADELKEEAEKRAAEAAEAEGDGAGGGESESEGGGKSDERGGESEDDGDSDSSAAVDMDDEAIEKAREIAEGVDERADTGDILNESKQQIIDMAKKEGRESGRYIPHPKAAAKDKIVVPKGSLKNYQDAKDVVKKQIHALRSKLLSIIRIQAQANTAVDRLEGELDTDALASVRLGNKRVFTETVPGQKLDVAISVLIDMSGSMGNGDSPGHKAYYAKLMAIALAETFDALHVPFEIMGFHNNNATCAPMDRDGYSRYEPFEYFMFKGFNEKMRHCRARFSEITGLQNNADGEALLFTAKRLAVRRETRKIMFVLSDGMPCAEGSGFHEHLIEAVKMITKAGITLLGIGAQTTSINDYYNKRNGAAGIVVDNIETLAVEVYKLMRGQLMIDVRHRKGRVA